MLNHPLHSGEDFDSLIKRFTPIVRFFREKLPNQSSVQLFLLYLIRHSASGHWAKLIHPEAMGYEQQEWWHEEFYSANEEAIKVAVETGRAKPPDENRWPYIYKATRDFEVSNNEELVLLQPPAKMWKDLKIGGFEWEGPSIDNYYPMVVYLKVKVDGERNPCVAVISVSYDSLETCAGYCLRELKQFLEEISKHLHIPISYLQSKLEEADWREWNLFRARTKSLAALHHAPFGGGGRAVPWLVADATELITIFRTGIGQEASAALDVQGYSQNVGEYFGQPADKPSVRELLQEDNGGGMPDDCCGIQVCNGGKSLTRLVNGGSSFWRASLLIKGQLHRDYWWFNPFALKKFVHAAKGAYDGLGLPIEGGEKNNFFISIAQRLRRLLGAKRGREEGFSVSLMEVDRDGECGMWFFVEEPGFEIAKGDPIKISGQPGQMDFVGGMGAVAATVRSLGASSIYVKDLEKVLEYKIPMHLDAEHTDGINPVQVNGEICQKICMKTGIAVFLKAQPSAGGWEIAAPTTLPVDTHDE